MSEVLILPVTIYLYDRDIEFPPKRGERYDKSIANATDIPPNGTARITYPFYQGQHFQLVITGAEFAEHKDYINAFQARISVDHFST